MKYIEYGQARKIVKVVWIHSLFAPGPVHYLGRISQ